MKRRRAELTDEDKAAARASNTESKMKAKTGETEEVAEARRTSDRERKRKERAEETEADSAARRNTDRENKRRERAVETEEDSAARRNTDRENKRRERAEETEADSAARRNTDRENKRRERAEETEEDSTARQNTNRENKRRERAEENEEDSAARRTTDADIKRKKRSEETEEVAEARRTTNRENMRKGRKLEKEDITKVRRVSERIKKMKLRREETESVTQARLASAKTGMRKRRSRMTNEDVEKRRMAEKIRTQTHRETEVRKETTFEGSAAKFLSRISEGPIYACCSCFRLHYRSAVLEMKIQKYNSEDIHYVVMSNECAKTHDKTWVCNTCHSSLKKGKVPVQSWANGLQLDDIPQELNNLRPLEIRLISQRIPFMKLVGLPRGGQKAIHGSAVNVPSKLQSVVSLLPRLPDTAEVVPLKLKRKLSYKGHYMYEYIRPQKVMTALRWLKQNNPLYKEITICHQWEAEWEGNDPDLWEAIVTETTEDVEMVDEEIIIGQENPLLSSKPTSHLPAGNDYQILTHIAREHNLKIKDVPGDGNCFFHAVSYSLSEAGLESLSGPDMRNRLIYFLDTTERKHEYLGFLQLPDTPLDLPQNNTFSQKQRQEFQQYIDGLREGQWADNLAVQGVSDMLDINIRVINTITPDWIHDIHPQQHRGPHTITIGLMGELHYVALTAIGMNMHLLDRNEDTNVPPANDREKDNSREKQALKTHDLEDEEDRIAFEHTSKLRGLPYDTLLQDEQVADGSSTFSVAPCENQKPTSFLSDEKFEELANPAKYPFGRGGLSENRQKKITPRKYFNQRLLHCDGRFAKDIDYLLAAQYAVEAKQVRDDIQISLRQTRGQTFQNSRINAGLMKSSANVQAMLRTDTAFKFMKNVRGSPAYWNTVLLDLLAMVRQLGTPTWFLTLSAADMQWPEVIQSIAHQYGKRLTVEDIRAMSWVDKCNWLRNNPVTAARQFKHRLDCFFKDFIGGKSNPIGKLQDYMIRIEFQARGSPHAHTILWIKDAPTLDANSDEEVVRFINEYQTCSIPDEEGDLKTLVLSLQKHIHSASCRRNGSCRFRFPHLPSSETLIAKPPEDPYAADLGLKLKQEICGRVHSIMEDKAYPEDISLINLLETAGVNPILYQLALKMMRCGKSVILQRQPSERWVNQYNPGILLTWRANMDLQFITDPYSCIMYITSYMLKSERSMSELLKRVVQENKDDDLKSKLKKVGSAFLNNREVSAQEAAYRLLSLPLKRASREVVFVNTAPKDKRVRILKPQNVLSKMHDTDEDIFCTSPIDRYIARPDELENMSLAEFSAMYSTGASDQPEEAADHIPLILDDMEENDDNVQAEGRGANVITLRDGLGHMRKRQTPCIIRFHKEKKEVDEKYRNLLMLYFPWRQEDRDLKGDHPSYQDHYENVRDIVRANEAKFSINAEELDRAFDDLQQMGPPDAGWDAVAPNVEFQQAEQEAEGIVRERDLPEEDNLENVDLARDGHANRSELHLRFSAELNKTLMSPQEYRRMIRSLNTKQMEVLTIHRKWCKESIIALKHNKPMSQYTIFLSGPGGVGKSHIIKLIHYETMKLLKPLSGHFEPDELPVLLTAFTGTAAFGIEGMTLHSSLGLSCGPGSRKEYQAAGSEKLNTLRSRLGKLKLLIIDEVSMVGADLLFHIHRRLQDICGNSDPDQRFGGVSILAVGDLYQLQPVGQNHVFALPSDSYARLHGSLWEENFSMMELTESMRQKNDQAFAELLMRVRTASCTDYDIGVLKSRMISKSEENYPYEALHVFKTNREVDDHNQEHLNTLTTRVFEIKAIDKTKDVQTGLIDVVISTKPSDTGGLRELLSVGVGARVMVTVNIDVSDGLANGVCGSVVGIENTENVVHTIFVQFDSPRVGVQAIVSSQYLQRYPDAVPITRQAVQFYTGRGRRSVEAKRTQFPLSLAWGCTIHKVQGKTLEQVVVSMEGRGSFMPGQIYVALSRVKNIKDLYLLGFKESAIRVNPAVVNEMNRLRQCGSSTRACIDPTNAETHLNIRLLNIRSYREHLEDLHVCLPTVNVDVCCFVETFLKEHQQIEPLFQPSKIFRLDRPSSVGRGGGVLTVAKENLEPRRIDLTVRDVECLGVTVTKLSRKVCIVLIYRPPSSDTASFIDKLNDLLNALDLSTLTVILGDFNFDLIENQNHNIITVMETFGFKQLVKSPTTDYGSLLDHVYVNLNGSHQIDIQDTYYSDHDTVCVSLNLV